MEEFEITTLNQTSDKPRIWDRYVDDTFTVLKRNSVESFITHLNSIHKDIKFTRETEKDGCLPFLDSLICRKEDGSLELKVYRKPTHTNQYLNFNSHHPLHQKIGIVHTLRNRCDKIVTTEQDKIQERRNIDSALKVCGYPAWCLKDRVKTRKDSDTQEDKKCVISLPYIQGVNEKLARIYKKHDITLVSKPDTTIRDLLVKPKDRTDKKKICGSIYKINCRDCDSFYLGESSRQLTIRLAEHHKSNRDGDQKSATSEHVIKTGHCMDFENTEVIDCDTRYYQRKIKEAIWIRTHKPQINRDVGVNLSHIFDPILKLPNGVPPATISKGNV